MTMRQPDIEIYLKDADHIAIGEWLSNALGTCTPWQQKGQTFKCKAGDIPVTWLPKAVGKWHSLLLESDATPWADDLACAQAAFVDDDQRGLKFLYCIYYSSDDLHRVVAPIPLDR